MLITSANLALVFGGFKTVFQKAFESTEAQYLKIATPVPSTTREEVYGWLGNFPRIREWIGDRIINNLSLHDFTIKNRKFEMTYSVKRDDIADDRYGVLSPHFQEMARAARQHPDELVFGLLSEGFSTRCYDGQNFFDADHPVKINDQEVSISNYMPAADPQNPGAPWFLLDTSRPIKPLIWQEREGYDFQHLDRDSDENVFMRDEYLFGVRARGNAGFGLWQMAYASHAPLTKENYELARAAMRGFKADNGRPLGIVPTTLVVGGELEGAALRVLKDTVTAGEANEWAGTADLVVSSWL